MTSQYEPTITPEMRARYIARRREDLAKLEQALVAGDFETLRAVAHQIKGNAATFSFVDLEQAAVGLEAAVDSESRDACEREVAAIKAWLSRQV